MKDKRLLVVLLSVMFMLSLGTTALAEKPILIAAPIPLTGPYATDGELQKKGFEMFADEVNAKGGLLGRKLKVVYGDIGAMEPEKVKSVGERLVAEKPDLIMTGYDNSGTFVFGEYDIPYLHGNGMSELTDPVAKNPDKYWNVFHFAPLEKPYGDDALNIFVEKIPPMIGWKPPNKKVAIITVDFSYSTGGAKRFAELAEKAGYEVVVNEIVNFGHAEYGPILSKIESTEPAFITYWHIAPDDPARFMTQFNDFFGDDGYNGLIWNQYSASIPEYIQLAGKAGNGIFCSTGAMGVTAKSKAYIKRWTTRYKTPPESFYASFARDALEMWAAAVKRAGCADCYKEVARQLREYPYEGMEGYLYVYNPINQSVIYGEGLFPLTIVQFQKEQAVEILPARMSKGDPVKPYWLK
ncbi:hypothetical protein JY97_10505 [Alkalispirochaeta odontotermitis]|nr:hypothetical protein JY97_10505 [Alkalispirochaeta odontotermitis]CAB1079392.1 hypothetical protein D1AOALGA4SA_7106 [Olavius algarvensis Delta 1 endosymbiont]